MFLRKRFALVLLFLGLMVHTVSAQTWSCTKTENGNRCYEIKNQKVFSLKETTPTGQTTYQTWYMFAQDSATASVTDCKFGVRNSYYPNGVLFSQSAWANNLPLGLSFYRYVNGKPKLLKWVNGLEVMWLSDGTVAYTHIRNFNTGQDEWCDTSEALLRSWYKQLLNTDALQMQSNESLFLLNSFLHDTILLSTRNNYISHGNWLAAHHSGMPFLSGTDYMGKPCGTYTRNHYYKTYKVYQEIFDTEFGPNAKLLRRLHYSEDNGLLIRKEQFKNGKEDGWQVSYHFNGIPSDSFLMVNGKNGGIHISMKENGKPFRVLHFNADGKPEGVHQYWYFEPYGDNLMQTVNYKNGLRNGMAWYYYPNGQLKQSGRFVNDTQEGKWVWYDSTGVLLETSRYTKGVKKIIPDGMCHDAQPQGNRYLQNLSTYVNEDSIFFHSYEFPYHKSVWNLLSKCYTDNTHFDSRSRGDRSYMTFELVAYEFIDLEFPGSNGIRLRLNPCWHRGEESRLLSTVYYNKEKPDLTQLYIEAPQAKLIFPNFLTNVYGKPYSVDLNAQSLSFSTSGMDMQRALIKLPDSAKVLNSMKLKFDHISVSDLRADSGECVAFTASGTALFKVDKRWIEPEMIYLSVSEKNLYAEFKFDPNITADSLNSILVSLNAMIQQNRMYTGKVEASSYPTERYLQMQVNSEFPEFRYRDFKLKQSNAQFPVTEKQNIIILKLCTKQ